MSVHSVRASVLPRWPLRLHRRLHRHHAGRAAFFRESSPARDPLLWREHGWTRTPRFDRERSIRSKARFACCCAPSSPSQALEQIRAQLNGSPDVRELVDLSSRPSAACTSEFLRAHLLSTRPRFSFIGTHRRQRTISVSGARSSAQPGNRHGRDRDSRRGFPRSRKSHRGCTGSALVSLSRTLELLHEEGVNRAVRPDR